jgi:hypothetical protein
MTYTTRLSGGNVNFQSMMENGFGIVTVMNALVFKGQDAEVLKGMTAYDVVKNYGVNHPDYLCTLDTLKVANVTMEGPNKTVTGGRYSNPLIKFGKSARLEMQDALGNSEAIESLCGGIQEWNESSAITGLHFGEDFCGPKMIIGDTFFIDRKSGQQVKVKIVFYQFLPDSIFNLTQDAEGDATVFDMNGDLMTTEIKVGSAQDGIHGLFYSIVDPNEAGENKPTRRFASEEDVALNGASINPGMMIEVYNSETKVYDKKTVDTVSESYDSANKKVVYAITYTA